MENKSWLEGLEKHTATWIEDYIDQCGITITQSSARSIATSDMIHLARKMSDSGLIANEARLGVTLLFELAAHTGDFAFLREFAHKVEDKVLAITSDMDNPPSPDVLAKAFCETYHWEIKIADHATAQHPFYSPFLNFAWNHNDWSAPIMVRPGWIRALARWHPRSLVEVLSNHPETVDRIMQRPLCNQVFEETDLADELFVDWATKHLTAPSANGVIWSSGPTDRCKAFFDIRHLSDLRSGKYEDLVMKLSAIPEFATSEHAINILMRHCPDKVLETVAAGIEHQTTSVFTNSHRKLIELAIRKIDGAGDALLRQILGYYKFQYGWAEKVNSLLLSDPAHPHVETIRKIYLDHAAGLSGKKISDFWAVIAKYDKGLFLTEWQIFAEAKSKPLREAAAGWMHAHQGEDIVGKVDQLIQSNATHNRLAAVSMLASSASDQDIVRLQSMHGSEPTKQVRVAIAAVLAKHGIAVAPEPEKVVEGIEDFAEFEQRLAAKPKSIKMPKAPWFSPETLPPLFAKDGSPLSDLALTFLFQRQAREKGELNEEVVPMLAHLDREQNAPFAHALLDQWFASDMKATTRWALDVAGITGDDSIIRRLIDPIEHWCMGNNGSRAEWAAHAIALLGSEKALGTLDDLIHRYRSRRKYVGAAASLAIFRTAEMMGISADELAERIVPDFGFKAEGEKDFPLRKGTCTAVLCHDFKIAFKEGEKLVANPPAKLADESEEELKETRKFLKEAITRQTLRLQDSMIGGKRWALDVWRARFEVHALFRIFAMRLIWGIYGEEGKLLRTFRLYPNGLTADATGGLEEFPEPDAAIGIPHRMELDKNAVKDWASHLQRFKVKPVFKQLDRPVHILDTEHGNRRAIRLTEGVKTTAGILRKELLGRGWSLSAAGDGGSLMGMWRRFPGSTIEAYLPVGDLHALSSKEDKVKLEATCFAHGNPAKNNYRDFPSEEAAVTFGTSHPLSTRKPSRISKHF